jgi:hypothetical protein
MSYLVIAKRFLETLSRTVFHPDESTRICEQSETSEISSHRPAVENTARLTPDQRDLFEERAAIREYDGGFLRAEAETLACVDVTGSDHRRASLA